MNAWIFLALAIVFEVTGTFFLKLSSGFEKWHWGVMSMTAYIGSFWCLAPAMKIIPVGIVYAIWAGVGIVAASAIGLFVFKEHLGMVQYFFIAMILIGAVGLNLTITH